MKLSTLRVIPKERTNATMIIKLITCLTGRSSLKSLARDNNFGRTKIKMREPEEIRKVITTFVRYGSVPARCQSHMKYPNTP